MGARKENLWLSTYMLALEASEVMTLRALKLMAGGHAANMEAARMSSEKVSEAFGAWVTLATGGTWPKVVGKYRKRVGANARRLRRR
jgi:hypothetical protein